MAACAFGANVTFQSFNTNQFNANAAANSVSLNSAGTNIVDSTDLVLNTIYTNSSGSNLLVTVGLVTTPGATAGSGALEINQSPTNNFPFITSLNVYVAIGGSSGINQESVSGFVQPGGVYVATNLQGIVSILANSCQRVYSPIGGGVGPPGPGISGTVQSGVIFSNSQFAGSQNFSAATLVGAVATATTASLPQNYSTYNPITLTGSSYAGAYNWSNTVGSAPAIVNVFTNASLGGSVSLSWSNAASVRGFWLEDSGTQKASLTTGVEPGFSVTTANTFGTTNIYFPQGSTMSAIGGSGVTPTVTYPTSLVTQTFTSTVSPVIAPLGVAFVNTNNLVVYNGTLYYFSNSLTAGIQDAVNLEGTNIYTGISVYLSSGTFPLFATLHLYSSQLYGAQHLGTLVSNSPPVNGSLLLLMTTNSPSITGDAFTIQNCSIGPTNNWDMVYVAGGGTVANGGGASGCHLLDCFIAPYTSMSFYHGLYAARAIR